MFNKKNPSPVTVVLDYKNLPTRSQVDDDLPVAELIENGGVYLTEEEYRRYVRMEVVISILRDKSAADTSTYSDWKVVRSILTILDEPKPQEPEKPAEPESKEKEDGGETEC